MSDQSSPTVRAKRGVIGTRQLIAVQTFDIARLTAHPVGIIPGTFVAVTGRGPKDSNESGKTSFLAALALLLGDPEWRMSAGGSIHARRLLFEPVTAGASPDRHGPAHVGYVVGVFAEPQDPQATAHTVWLQISAKPQHIEVRHRQGVHLLLEGGDRERHERAPDFFRRLGGKPLGPTEYAEALYGRAPRLLAYIATRGGIRSRPSLLKLDAGNFNPAQIGDALLSLTGRGAILSNDVAARKALAQTQADLDEKLKQGKASHRAEEAILHSVDARNRARRETVRASDFHHRARARALIDAQIRTQRITAQLAAVDSDLAALAQQHGAKKTELAQARNTGQLRHALTQAQLNKTAADQILAHANREEGKLRGDLGRAEEDHRHASDRAEGYAGPSPAELGALVSEHERKQVAKLTELNVAASRVEALREELAEAREGRTGAAATVLRTLLSEKVEAVGLMAATRVHAHARPNWEARLAPWRDAVCVAPGDLERATEAVAAHPGALLITGPTPPGVAGFVPLAGMRSAPEGIHSTDPLAVPFLHALAHSTRMDRPPHASLPALGVHVIGGFEQPIAGQEDICAHLQHQLHDAENLRKDLAGMADLHHRRIIELKSDIERANASDLAKRMVPKIQALEQTLSDHLKALPDLQNAADGTSAAAHQAKVDFDTAQERADVLAAALGALGRKIEGAERKRDGLRAMESDPTAGQARTGWAGSPDDALIALNWAALPEQDPDADPDDQADTRSVTRRDPAHEAERRTSADLDTEGRIRLASALTGLASDSAATGVATQELADALRHHEAGTPDPAGRIFRTSLRALDTWLQDNEARDAGARELVEAKRKEREEEHTFLQGVVEESRYALAETQESIRERVQSALDRISKTLNSLDAKDRGYGADLHYDITAPTAAEDQWTCHVVPRWRRNPSGPLLDYDAPTNTAQEKLFSIHLVLAALLAAPDPQGRVLILDELGDSLGAEHRREVIAALRDAAQDHGITVLATCQDGLMSDVRQMCGQILQFRYRSKSDALNRPTLMFGFDTNRQRVTLTLEDLVQSRH
ncbi:MULTISPECIES: hypothetical protein [unclassified Streptomyces]|uniref:hypothetical protein n=1 Tax=unclassified Streptomyces TaxID=2593676 RepID=UPI001BE804D4|nr:MULTISPECIES: hypothetical protein [unclassified Streptomyces]MBT2406005.1 hypothetical protein [Streptomyces sp. ISL-21]MBT2611833.1 hypothetical protein [Streptomyces sp. ISL-87]